MDLLFMMDGSGSMAATFGPYSHGFYGMISQLKSWVPNLPLTKTTASQTVTSTTQGFRVGFIQFSKEDRSGGAWCTDNRWSKAGTTGCKFSGDSTELANDLDAHKIMYQKSVTYLAPGLADAVTMFKAGATNSPAGRKRVMIVLGDGSLSDTQSSIKPQQAALSKLGVETFIVVMRKSSASDAQSNAASASLQPLANDPKSSHFLNIMLSEVKTKVLDGLCDPKSTFGAALASATTSDPVCSTLLERECNTWSHCEWDKDKSPTCPNEGGCWQLDCAVIPTDYVKAGMKCDNCMLVSGAVQCRATYNNPLAKGACVHSECVELALAPLVQPQTRR